MLLRHNKRGTMALETGLTTYDASYLYFARAWHSPCHFRQGACCVRKIKSRRRPTLSGPEGSSTIGAGNFMPPG